MSNVNKIKMKILTHIEIPKFYARYIKNFDPNCIGRSNILCPFSGHKDTNPSFRIYEDGSFKCFGCNAWGSNPITFYQMLKGIDFNTTLLDLYSTFVEKLVDPLDIMTWHQELLNNKDKIYKLEKERGWSVEVIKRFKLGLADNRISIPIENTLGLITKVLLYNVFEYSKYPKFQPIEKGMSTTILYPISIIQEFQNIILVEGFSDVYAALSNKIAAITTGRSGAWRDIYSEFFVGKTVTIISDSDMSGYTGARKLATVLTGIAESVKLLTLSHNDPNGNDLTDWFNEGHTAKDLLREIAEAEYYALPNPTKIVNGIDPDNEGLEFISFTDLLKSENYYKPIRIIGEVIGKGDYSYFIPSKIRIKCEDNRDRKRMCKICPLVRTGITDFSFEEYNKHILRLTNCTVDQQQRVIRDICKIGRNCLVDFTSLSNMVAESLLIHEPTDKSNLHKPSKQMVCYSIGQPVINNKTYVFEGYSLPHPKDGSITAMFYKNKSIQSSIENFELTEGIKEALLKFKATNIEEKLRDIYTYYENKVSFIKNRFDLHMGVDLVFFSPVSFKFNGELIHNATLDFIAFGDHRCGKSRVAESIVQFYQTGEVISGENISFMNLVAGIANVTNKFRGIRFGRFAANHLGTVVIDEMSALDPSIIGKTSRVRSEGIVEIDKDGRHAKAPANCGKIWLSNPRDKRPMANHSYGCEVLLDLVPAPEDVARFDYAIAVASGEVDSNIINMEYQDIDTGIYPGIDNQNLICWVKSRKVDQIEFTPNAVKLILDKSKEWGKLYTTKIPLIQPENFRIKLAKISAAIAGRIFNSDKNGNKLIIDCNCVEAALIFLDNIYSNPIMNYKFYSELQRQYDLIDEKRIHQEFDKLKKRSEFKLAKCIDGLLKTEFLTIQDFMAYTTLDKFLANRFIGFLLVQNCVIRKYATYIKTSSFIKLLKRIKIEDNESTR